MVATVEKQVGEKVNGKPRKRKASGTAKAGKAASVTKTPKPRKPKKVTMLDTELEPLKEADSLLGKIERAEAVCDEKLVEVDQIREQLKQAKGAYSHAVTQLRKLCRARKEKHPLFDQVESKPEAKAETKPEAKPEAKPVLVTIRGDSEVHGLTVGEQLPIWLVKPGGVLVKIEDGNPVAITDLEFDGGCDVLGLIEEARRTEGVLSNADAWTAFVASKHPQAVTAESPKPVNDGWMALPLKDAGMNGKAGTLLNEAGIETLGQLQKLMKDYGQFWNKEVKGIGAETAAQVADLFADFWSAHPEYCQA